MTSLRISLNSCGRGLVALRARLATTYTWAYQNTVLGEAPNQLLHVPTLDDFIWWPCSFSVRCLQLYPHHIIPSMPPAITTLSRNYPVVSWLPHQSVYLSKLYEGFAMLKLKLIFTKVLLQRPSYSTEGWQTRKDIPRSSWSLCAIYFISNICPSIWVLER